MIRERVARRALKELGVLQRWTTRQGPILFFLAILLLAVLLVVHDACQWSKAELRYLAIPLATLGVFTVGWWQWLHHRNEVSISGSLERLDIVNRYFSEPGNHVVVQHFFGGDGQKT